MNNLSEDYLKFVAQHPDKIRIPVIDGTERRLTNTEVELLDFPASGIRVREYFACVFLQGMLSRSNSSIAVEQLVKDSVIVADLLIEELNRNPDEIS